MKYILFLLQITESVCIPSEPRLGAAWLREPGDQPHEAGGEGHAGQAPPLLMEHIIVISNNTIYNIHIHTISAIKAVHSLMNDSRVIFTVE